MQRLLYGRTGIVVLRVLLVVFIVGSTIDQINQDGLGSVRSSINVACAVLLITLLVVVERRERADPLRS